MKSIAYRSFRLCAGGGVIRLSATIFRCFSPEASGFTRDRFVSFIYGQSNAIRAVTAYAIDGNSSVLFFRACLFSCTLQPVASIAVRIFTKIMRLSVKRSCGFSLITMEN